MPDPSATIDWRNSEAKDIILRDLHEGVIPMNDEEVADDDVYVWYQQFDAFKNVGSRQFKARLKGHREQIQRNDATVDWEVEAYMHDRLIHPERMHDRHGNIKFYLTPGRELLRQDLREGKHKTMGIEDLYTSRDEYQVLPLRKFRQRVRQEIRALKFINYLEDKRAKKFGLPPPTLYEY